MHPGSRPLFHENFPSISRFQLEIQVEIQLELHFSFFDGLQSLFANRDPVTTFLFRFLNEGVPRISFIWGGNFFHPPYLFSYFI